MFQGSSIILFVVLANLWIWKIFSVNLFLGLLVLITTVFLYLYRKEKSRLLFFILPLILLLIFQWNTTERVPLTYLDNDEQRVQQMRLSEYPAIPIPIAWWFEGRNESIAFFRIQKNLGEALDPNLYFFANHPRERVGSNEFEKFPYIFLPFFLLGLLNSVKARRWILLLSVILPLVLISLIGHKNPLGPFSLFPFLVIATMYGVEYAMRALPSHYKTKILLAEIALFILVFIQTIAYARY